MVNPIETTPASTRAERRRLSSRHLLAAVAIVASVTLLGGGIAVAQRDNGRHRGGKGGLAGAITAVSSPTFSVARRGGDTKTVTTTAETAYTFTTGATVADAVPGAFVAVRGERADGGQTIAARLIHIKPTKGWTVVTNDGSTLTVQRTDGTVRTVTTTPDTKVFETTTASFNDLVVGRFVVVQATRNSNDGKVARRVAIYPAKAPASSTTSTVVPLPIARPNDITTTTAGPQRVAATPPTVGTPVRAFGQVAAISGTSFVLERKGATQLVATNAATDYSGDSSLGDLAVRDWVKVEGTQQADGSVLATEVRSFQQDNHKRRDRDR